MKSSDASLMYGSISTRKLWYWSIFLALPVLVLYAAHCFWGVANGNLPSGFIQDDMPSYLANAREHFDSGHFTLTYGNPYSADSNTPKIYFQPMTLLFALIWRATGLDPGLIFAIYGLIAAILAIRVTIALFAHLFPLATSEGRATLLCFIWGGGIITICTVGRALAGHGYFDSLNCFDPGTGWWFLNLGRNFIFPTEATYHAIVFGCIVFLWKKQYVMAMLLLALLSISHPFTGIEFILIVSGWIILEKYFLRSAFIPHWVVVATLAIGVLHFSYYLVFLPRSPEHASLMAFWKIPWLLNKSAIVAAYSLVAGLVLVRCWKIESIRSVLSVPENRFLLIWFAVAFVLANHELLTKPVQPLHFTRGYIWTPLFLLGAPTLSTLFGKILKSLHPRISWALIDLAVLFVCLDNLIWFITVSSGPVGFYRSHEFQQLMSCLSDNTTPHTLLVSNDPDGVCSPAMAYTPLRCWLGHWANTPYVQQRRKEVGAFLMQGEKPVEWKGRRILVVLSKRPAGAYILLSKPMFDSLNAKEALLDNALYRVVAFNF